MEPLKLEGEELATFLWGKISEQFTTDNGREPSAIEELAMKTKLRDKLQLPPLDESIFLAAKLDGTALSGQEDGEELDDEDIDEELIEQLREVLHGSAEQIQKLEAAAALPLQSEEQYSALKEIMIGLTEKQKAALMGDNKISDGGSDGEIGDELEDGDDLGYEDISDDDTSGNGGGKGQGAIKVKTRTIKKKIKKTRAIGGVRVAYKTKK
jgi:hypothetical protein